MRISTCVWHRNTQWKKSEIWQPGQKVFTCGGKLPGDAFTEAAVGKRYLIERGVREDAIVAVEKGSDSWASINAVTQHSPGRVLVITDPNHSLRATVRQPLPLRRHHRQAKLYAGRCD